MISFSAVSVSPSFLTLGGLGFYSFFSVLEGVSPTSEVLASAVAVVLASSVSTGLASAGTDSSGAGVVGSAGTDSYGTASLISVRYKGEDSAQTRRYIFKVFGG